MISGNVKLELLYPTVDQAAIYPVTKPLSDSAIEFTKDDLHPTGRDPVAVQHDITGSIYTFTIMANTSWFFDSSQPANDYVLTFDGLGGTSGKTFYSADILTNDMSFAADDVTASGNTLDIDLSGHIYKPNAVLSVQLGFAYTGKGGADRLVGDNGRDMLNGGAGNDKLIGGAGADKLVGGTGSDTASYITAASGVTADLTKPSSNKGDAKGDTYSSIENLEGSKFTDRLFGDAGKNVLKGDAGNDVLQGAAGNDSLYGSNGNDRLYGGTGNDKLYGGLGADDLYGGTGNDIFYFTTAKDSTVSAAGRDTIFDFEIGDKIHLVGIDADTTHAGNQKFDFIGTSAFSGDAGELRYKKMASDTVIYGDLNGDKKADFSIHLDDAVALQKSYFFL